MLGVGKCSGSGNAARYLNRNRSHLNKYHHILSANLDARAIAEMSISGGSFKPGMARCGMAAVARLISNALAPF